MKVCVLNLTCSLLCKVLTSFSQFATLILAVLAATATASVIEPGPVPVPDVEPDLAARVRTYFLHSLVPVFTSIRWN